MLTGVEHKHTDGNPCISHRADTAILVTNTVQAQYAATSSCNMAINGRRYALVGEQSANPSQLAWYILHNSSWRDCCMITLSRSIGCCYGDGDARA